VTASAEAVRAEPRARPWHLLASPPFLLLFSSTLLALLGDTFSLVAMPWLVLQLTGSGLALGTVLALESVPRAVLMLVGGAVVDRFSPRTTMLLSIGVRAVLIAGLAALVLGHAVQLWEVYAIALLVGTISAFLLPARYAILPSVVADPDLEAGNALLNLSAQGTGVVGPVLAGLLVAAVGTGAAFASDAAAFSLATVLLLLLPAASRPAGGAENAGLLSEIRAGLAYAWRDAGLRSVLLVVAAVDFCAAAAISVGVPVLTRQRFSQGAVAFGALLAGWGIGAMAGVIAAGLTRVPRRFGLVAMTGVIWLGLWVAMIGVVPSLPLAVAAAALAGIAAGLLNTYFLTWLQRRTDEAFRGRVMGLVMLASQGLVPLALLLAGVVVQQQVEALFVAAGAIIAVSGAGSLLSRTVRSL
jgi:MFS family permease